MDATGDPALVTRAVDPLRSPVITLELACEGCLYKSVVLTFQDGTTRLVNMTSTTYTDNYYETNYGITVVIKIDTSNFILKCSLFSFPDHSSMYIAVCDL